MAHLAHNAIDHFKKVVTGFAASWAYDLGEDTLTADPDFLFYGVVQPATEADLEANPELQRLKEPLTLHTRKELILSDNDGDKQTYIKEKGHVYKLIALGNWSQWSFYKYGLERVESVQIVGATGR